MAVSFDGRQILAHAPTLEDLVAETDRLGLKDYVVSFVMNPDVSYFGGSLEFSDWDITRPITDPFANEQMMPQSTLPVAP